MAKVLKKQKLTLFPTYLYKGHINDNEFIDGLKNQVIRLKQEGDGQQSSFPGQFETWDDLHEKPEFKQLVELVLMESKEILDEYKLKRDSHYITTMWSAITNKTYTHTMHNHPNCFLSGLLYLNAPEGCGALSFRDPRPCVTVLQYDVEERNSNNSNRQTIHPEKGDIYFWPHWLDHCVERHHDMYTGEEDRIMIAFNIMVKTDIKIKTAKLRI